MLSSSLNTSLKRYVETLPSRNTMFVTGAYESGKSQTLNLLAEDLFTKQRLVFNLDASKFPDEVSFISHLKTSLLDGLLKLRPYLSSDIIKSLNPRTHNKSIPLPSGLDPLLGPTYLRISKSIDQIVTNDGGISTTGVRSFLDTLQSFSSTIRPVIILHAGDALFGTRLSAIVSSALSRKNLYNDFVPAVVELRDSSFLNAHSGPSSASTVRVACSEDFNESAHEALIRAKVFSAYELRRAAARLGGALAHVYEDLKFGVGIDEAIEREERRIEEGVAEAMQRVGKRTKFVGKLCRSGGKAFGDDEEEVKGLKPLFERGFLYTDEMMNTRVANKAVLRAICSNK